MLVHIYQNDLADFLYDEYSSLYVTQQLFYPKVLYTYGLSFEHKLLKVHLTPHFQVPQQIFCE